MRSGAHLRLFRILPARPPIYLAGTHERIGIVLGVPSIYELFDEKYYTDLPGGVLDFGTP